MAKRLSLKDQVAAIKMLSTQPVSDDSITVLKEYLANKNNVIVNKAALAIKKLQLREINAELVAAFQRFMENPVKTDPNCLAKTAIIETLYELDFNEYEPFLTGLHHRQLELVFGGQADTAANLRGICAQALASCNYPDILFELTTVLMDKELQPRMAAISALSYLAYTESELLLRMKVLAGDPEAEVTGKCFSALMQLNPERSVLFVADYLNSMDIQLVTEAAMALGESRLIEALNILTQHYDNNFFGKIKKMLILPIALSRREEALDFLIDQLPTASVDIALEIIQQLPILTPTPEKIQTIRNVIKSRDNSQLETAFYDAFE